jgi:hypothetical protein
MPVLWLAVLLLQSPCGGEAARHLANAVRLGQGFDLAGAADEYSAAVKAGCIAAQVAATYVRGLVLARAADAQFGSAASMQPLTQAVASLQSLAAADPVARMAHAVLRAAMPAAQHERAEMTLFIEEMLRLETIQLEAGLPGLPIVTAHEAAGQFWLQLHLYDEAARAFDLAAKRIGVTPHVMVGAARAAAGRRDFATACDQYTRLISWWAKRAGAPPEMAEAQGYVKQPQCAPAPAIRR